MAARLVICADSALDMCGKLAAAGRKIAMPTRVKSLAECVSTKRMVRTFNLAELPIETASTDGGLHVLIDSNASRFSSKDIVRHVWSGVLPAGSLYKVAQEVYVTSPEFSLLLISQKCEFNNLVMRCCEACGAYGIESSGKGFYARPALTSIAKITAFLDRAGSIRGSAKLRRALKYAFDNAYSPMETAIAMLMSYPARMGGYGFPKPILNYRMELDSEASRMAGKKFVFFDFYFPDRRVAVEYDSDQEHTGADRIASDSRRNNTLRDIGFVVINLTWAQVRNSQALDAAMLQVAHALDKPLREPSASARAKRAQLRADVLPRIHDMVDAIDTRLVK